jgi:6-phosphogluconolactonase
MKKRFQTDEASSEPTRRTCLKGAAGFALAALGGLNQVAQAATATTPGAAVSGETIAASPAGEPGTVFAYVGCRTTKERNARGEGSTSTG